MRKALLPLFTLLFFHAFSQPSEKEPEKLVVQKENVIKENTIVKIENLGWRVNSELAELRPTISADGNHLFFICENHPLNTKYNAVRNSQDIWYSQRDSFGKWSDAKHLGYPLNTYHFNAVFWISPDNNRILIRNAFVDGDYWSNGVSMCHRLKNGKWSPPQMLKIRNYHKYDRGQQNGATMAQDGETLYFSSNRPGGSGDNDIWMSKRLDKTWQKWSEPVNLGTPINSPEWDAFFTMDAGGEYAYMSSSLSGYGESDIVRVKLLEKEKPLPVVLVTGNVFNAKTMAPLSASLVYQTLPDGVVAGNGVSNP